MNIIPNGNVYRVAFPASVHAPNSLKYSCCLQLESLCTLLHSTSKALQDSERKTLRHPMHLWGEHIIARTQQKQNTNQNENDRNQEPCSRNFFLPQSKAVQTVIHTPAAATVRRNQKMIRTGERQEQFLSTPLTPSQQIPSCLPGAFA